MYRDFRDLNATPLILQYGRESNGQVTRGSSKGLAQKGDNFNCNVSRVLHTATRTFASVPGYRVLCSDVTSSPLPHFALRVSFTIAGVCASYVCTTERIPRRLSRDRLGSRDVMHRGVAQRGGLVYGLLSS